ncbi:MAG: hypothetical protein JWM27_1483 [Gemmatimonadetes bacterium]|nr:hypothetical protein [Gemmatimonadota bacterium]
MTAADGSAGGEVDAGPTRFAALRAVRTATIHLHASPDRVFRLFTPEGERAWVPGWDPVHRHPAGGGIEPGAVFVTRGHGAEVETVWMVTRYDPAALHATYNRVTPGLHAVVVDVACVGAAEGGTLARVGYTYTALSEDGNATIARQTDGAYAAMMGEWESAINAYLRGTRAAGSTA